eukprot:CAMPEP_0175425420 /NCGR_PEP_ID=MMETSP0095-20121207/49290_1 /TAXON_ID=311494 /ORGANISM="Alexandrium monilatum, Strain CCMP3105" /LENGTH=194 /DNA_ID=CAMNT_0016724751 /DNA_START=189 /DNA_END=770 /DNA_ORIENTATION=+
MTQQQISLLHLQEDCAAMALHVPPRPFDPAPDPRPAAQASCFGKKGIFRSGGLTALERPHPVRASIAGGAARAGSAPLFAISLTHGGGQSARAPGLPFLVAHMPGTAPLPSAFVGRLSSSRETYSGGPVAAERGSSRTRALLRRRLLPISTLTGCGTVLPRLWGLKRYIPQVDIAPLTNRTAAELSGRRGFQFL